MTVVPECSIKGQVRYISADTDEEFSVNPLCEDDSICNEKEERETEPDEEEDKIVTSNLLHTTWMDQMGHKVSKYIISCLRTRISREKLPWVQLLIPYVVTIAWINFNTWGMMIATFPFSMDNVSADGDGATNQVFFDVLDPPNFKDVFIHLFIILMFLQQMFILGRQ